MRSRAARPGRRATDAEKALAYRWRGAALEPIAHPDLYPLDALLGVERSIAKLRANVAAFTRGEPALDMLLYGERGTGKSSAVRGALGEFAERGFRLVEVRRDDLLELPALWPLLRDRRRALRRRAATTSRSRRATRAGSCSRPSSTAGSRRGPRTRC